MPKPKQKAFQIKKVTSKDQRSKGAQLFTRLKDKESMKGYALFAPDPSDENPHPSTYLEYYEHYDKSNNAFVPCVGENCYMCEVGDSPSQRALTLWYFPDNDSAEQLKVFKLNGWLISDFTEIDEEEGGVLGRKFRVKRTSADGKYRSAAQNDKPLTKAEIKKLIADGPDLEELVLKQARAAWEKHQAAEAMEDVDDEDDTDDDDDDEDETENKSKSRKGKEKKSSKDDDDDETEDDDDEDEDEDESDDDDDETDDDDDDSDSDDDDEDDDDDDDSDDDDSDDDDDDDEDSETIEDAEFVIEKTDEDEETYTVKIDGKATKMWIAEDLDVEWDDLKKGVTVVVSAMKDEDNDWVTTKLKVKAAKGGGGKGKAKGGKKK